MTSPRCIALSCASSSCATSSARGGATPPQLASASCSTRCPAALPAATENGIINYPAAAHISDGVCGVGRTAAG
jgi:hypothetical protein